MSIITSTFAVIMATYAARCMAQEIILHKVDQAQASKSGIEIQSNPGLLQIVALRNDVLRITMSATTQLPEDASWAVLPASRMTRIDVTPTQDARTVGFNTTLLHVRVDRATLKLSICDASDHVISQDAQPVEFQVDDQEGDLGFRVSKTMPLDEHYFGLGDKTGPFDRRGGSYVMWNTDAYRFQEGTDPLYKSIPFFIGFRKGKSYGIFLDNTWRTTFDFGKQYRDNYSFGSEGGPLTYYFIYGPEPKKVESGYAWLTGTTPLPPLWSFGFQQSRYSYETEQRVREVANHLRADHIPADAIYLDIDYQQKNRPFTVSDTRFPDFSAFVQEMAKKQFHLVLVADLHIADAPNQGYAPYDSGTAGDHFVKNPDGTIYHGEVWPGLSAFPDFTQQQTRQWFGGLYKSLYLDGVSGFWDDMNEPSVFNTPTKTIALNVQNRIDEHGFKKRVTTQREAHNLFGIENARATYNGMLSLKPNQRPFVLTRATYAGGQRYGATWTGDNSSSWNHLRMSTPMLESLGLGGFYMAGDDIGGFAGSPSMDLLTTWLEVGAFNPMYRDHTEKNTNDQEPWAGGSRQEAIRRSYINERYRLLPYLYSIAEKASRTGIPIMRPLFLEFPEATADKHPLDLDAGNEFLLGPDLLIAAAPYPDELQDYAVMFPPAQWYDYWTGKKIRQAAANKSAPSDQNPVSTGAPMGIGALEAISIRPALNMLPVFVREGSILPLQPLVQNTEQKPHGPLELRVYPGPDCKGTLYQDDGITLNYQKGNYFRENYTCVVGSNTFQMNIGAVSGSYPAWWKKIHVVIYDWHTPKYAARLNGQLITSSQYDAAHGTLQLEIPQNAAGEVLRVTTRGNAK